MTTQKLTQEKIEIALTMFRGEATPREVAETIRSSIRTGQRLRNDMEQRYEREEWKLKERKKKGPKRQDREELRSSLLQAIHEQPQSTRKELAETLGVSTITIGNAMKEFGITRKRITRTPVARNSDEVIAARMEFENHRIMDRYEDLLFLDETGFNLHTLKIMDLQFKDLRAL